MPENLLTDLKVRSAKSTDRDWKLSDGGGLFLLVKPTGGKLWRWKYRLQGKENLFAIGGFPQVSLAEARAAREKARALVKQGIHPAHERQQVKQRNLEALEERKRARESSFAKVAQAYLAEIKPVFALSSYRTKESRIRKCVFRPIVTAHSEKGVTGDSEVVTGDSDLIVTDLGRRRNHRSRCRNRRSRSNRNGLCGQRGNHPCHGYPRALCAERRDAGGADCHAQHQGAVTAQVRLRALA